MRQLFSIILLIARPCLIFAQSDSLYAEIQVKSFTYNGKTCKLKKPKIIILETYGRSEIISLGSVENNEIGLQFEILKSKLGDTTLVINGKGYFLKKDGRWKMSKMSDFYQSNCKVILDKSEISDKDFVLGGVSHTSITTKQELSLEYVCRFYIFK